jgi:hypothetical protein
VIPGFIDALRLTNSTQSRFRALSSQIAGVAEGEHYFFEAARRQMAQIAFDETTRLSLAVAWEIIPIL